MSLRPWIFALAALATLAASSSAAQAATRDWIGSARCGSCHPQQLAAWRATAHGREFRAVGKGTERCLGCHSTGDAPAGAVIERAVGCEACHGAGADYAADDVMRNRRLAADLGLVDVAVASTRAALCASCHAAVTARAPLEPARPSPLSQPAHPPVESPR